MERMKPKTINLAEGRLGKPSLESPDAGCSARRKTNYGVGRLGITSDQDQEPSSASALSTAETPARQPAESLPELRRLLEPAQTTAPAVPERPAQDRVDERPEYVDATPAVWWKRRIYLAGGAVGVLLIVLVWWAVRPNGAKPSAAGASLTPAPTPAMHVAAATKPSPTDLAAAKPVAPAVVAPANKPMPDVATPALELIRAALIHAKENVDRSQPKLPAAVAVTTPTSAPALAIAEPDKTLPPTQWRDCPSGILLSGILRGTQGPVAIINDRPLVVGKSVDGATLVRIADYSVEMELDGQHFLVGVSSTQSQSYEEKPIHKVRSGKKSKAASQPAKTFKAKKVQEEEEAVEPESEEAPATDETPAAEE